MLIADKAIVLKRTPYSDTSLICRLFTKNNGKITVLAKGVYRAKKSTAALLEPSNHIYIQYYHKNSRNIQLLKDASFVNHYSQLRKKLSCIVLGLSIVEMIDKSIEEGNSYPILYRLSWRILNKLNN